MKNIIYGVNAVLDALRNTNRIQEIYLLSHDKNIEDECKQKKIKFYYKDKFFFSKISKGSQGIAAKVQPFLYAQLKLIDKTHNNSSVLILDRVQDPQNFGAIIRTATAASFDAIIVSKTNQVEVTPAVEKVAIGSVNHIPIIKVTNIANTIEILKDKGYWIIGTGLKNAQDYREIDYTGKTALVVGSEGFGIRRLVLEKCDYIVKLPISKKVESLNVSVATGIMCYHIHNVKNPLK